MPSKSERESPWFEVGTDAEFLTYIRTLPSAYSGITGQTVAAHYRTAANSGTGYKPPFSAIPLTWDEHGRQHQYGQYTFMPAEWWEEQVEKHLRMWKEHKEASCD